MDVPVKVCVCVCGGGGGYRQTIQYLDLFLAYY